MTIEELIEKLEAAPEASRELDADILEATVPLRVGIGFTCVRCGKDTYGQKVPAYTASLDAAVALAERVLPGWRICTEFGQNYSIAQFKRGWGPARTEYLGVATTERADDEIALCLCLAILKAVRAHMHPRDREEQNDG